jgi:hypothetical protein
MSDSRGFFDLVRTLQSTRDEVALYLKSSSVDVNQSWEEARLLVEEFDPVPWFVRRLTKVAFSEARDGGSNRVNEGAALGLNKILLAAASDAVIGKGHVVTDPREGATIVAGDVFAAAVSIHSIARKLQARDHKNHWMPILDQALMQAQIGFCVGSKDLTFGSGRGMLAGFTSRVGLCLLMATGDSNKAAKSMAGLMKNPDIAKVGLEVYGCNPYHIGSFLLSIIGCGSDASLGLVAFSQSIATLPQEGKEKKWSSALHLIEAVRTNSLEEVNEFLWEQLGFTSLETRIELEGVAHQIKRRGHSWGWLL